MKDEIFKINVNIGGFRLPLNIPRKDEEMYRKAEKQVNNLLRKTQQTYNQRSAEEILSIVAYQLAVNFYKKEFTHDAAPVIEKIKSLDEMLNNILSKDE